MRFPECFSILLLFLLLCPDAGARIIRVPQDAPEIPEAISATQNGDTVLVSPGEWKGNSVGIEQWSIPFLSGKNITIASLFLTTQDSSYIASTIISRTGDTFTIGFGAGVDSTTVLCGFTVFNNSFWNWGAIRCTSKASPTLRNLVINTIGGSAVGLMCDEAGHVRVFDSLFDKCVYGGAIRCENHSSLSLENTTITDCHGTTGFLNAVESELFLKNVQINKSTSFDNGIYLKNCPRIKMENVTITDCDLDVAAKGIIGAKACESVILDRVTMVDNILPPHPGDIEKGFRRGGVWIDSGELTILNSIVRENTPAEVAIEAGASPPSVHIAYSDIAGGREGISSVGNYTLDWGPGNIDADPLFADTANGDLRLKAGSPCIDAGTAKFTIATGTIIDLLPGEYTGAAPDMGAWEGPVITGVEEERPVALRILNIHPNPFNPSTAIEFSINARSHVELAVYNVAGQKVAILENRVMNAGKYSAVWNAGNFASGLYFARLSSDKGVLTRKMLFLK